MSDDIPAEKAAEYAAHGRAGIDDITQEDIDALAVEDGDDDAVEDA